MSLSTRKNFLFKSYSDTFLKAIPRYISDRNETVSQSYAAALGYVVRGASDASIVEVSALAKRLYFDAEDEQSRVTSGEVVRAVAKYSTDRFSSLGSEFLPFVFLAKNDDNTEVKKLFGEVWKDNTGGPRAASLYLDDVAQLSTQQLGSARWSIKHAAALAISEVITAVVATQGKISKRDAEKLWPALEQALAEKSWDGKEKILEGFALFVEKAPTAEVGVDAEIRKVGQSLHYWRP